MKSKSYLKKNYSFVKNMLSISTFRNKELSRISPKCKRKINENTEQNSGSLSLNYFGGI